MKAETLYWAVVLLSGKFRDDVLSEVVELSGIGEPEDWVFIELKPVEL